jgi:lauroyl/myristoyl acyltransferase
LTLSFILYPLSFISGPDLTTTPPPRSIKTRLMGVVRVIVGSMPLQVGNRVADLAGDLVYLTASRSRKAAIINLGHAMRPVSRQDLKRAVQGVFRNAMRNYYDLCRAPNLSDEEVDRSFDFDEEGWARIVDLYEKKRGVILASAHFGAFDMVGQVIGRREVDLRIMIAQVKPAWLSDFISDLRVSRGVKAFLVDTEEGSGLNLAALKDSIRFLKGGGVLGVLADRNTEKEGVAIPFFGREALVASGAAKIAFRTRSAVVVCVCKRVQGNRYQVTFDPPIEPTGSANNEEDIKTLLRDIFARFEHHIRLNPEQWVLLQPVWKEL